ncbi:5'-methylthioadenosine/adenosylhomocysteine nucleosidase [Dolosicoccus paucivorans]|uniref:adenosylhomocysteine nucleosidase n=1 Tax=Dolosicoccus paucivorans TaxID=84521 RepID=A0A1G8L9F1_9LACT|nr:5'-methylthioadenosine/adenosylhomocysteine nucleosidase [Dolosicoccus paucivorans]PMB84899.1 5'-methylthioadenosine/adenosylhomocysteine nucleosidase [Dolosicoccus paucivorans]PMC58895.1 5'-methylthioadenosine/adenosylhomocysteine nucleosidase [Dolosicoccus paucivorans]SDI52271.1 adenosylhomocysteine nucleosidase [Dolosicoccus paucivorans]
MTTIGIIGAMAEEVELLKERLENKQSVEKHSATYYTGQIAGINIVVVQSGIGKVNATISVATLVETFDVDLIINTGTAGALDEGLEVGDIVIANELIHHDVDVTGFDYEWGQMAGMPLAYYPTMQAMRLAQEACRLNGQEPILGLIVSGDQFVNSREHTEQIRGHFPTVRACDMESAAIAQASYVMDTSFIIIRAISDNANAIAPISFEDFVQLASRTSADLVYRFINLYATQSLEK